MHPSSTQCTHIRSQHQQIAPEAKGGGRANKNDEHTARSAEVTKLGGGQTIPRRTRGSCPAMPSGPEERERGAAAKGVSCLTSDALVLRCCWLPSQLCSTQSGVEWRYSGDAGVSRGQ